MPPRKKSVDDGARNGFNLLLRASPAERERILAAAGVVGEEAAKIRRLLAKHEAPRTFEDSVKKLLHMTPAQRDTVIAGLSEEGAAGMKGLVRPLWVPSGLKKEGQGPSVEVMEAVLRRGLGDEDFDKCFDPMLGNAFERWWDSHGLEEFGPDFLEMFEMCDGDRPSEEGFMEGLLGPDYMEEFKEGALKIRQEALESYEASLDSRSKQEAGQAAEEEAAEGEGGQKKKPKKGQKGASTSGAAAAAAAPAPKKKKAGGSKKK